MEHIRNARCCLSFCVALTTVLVHGQGDFQWEQRADYPGQGRMGAFTFVADGKGYVAGGYNTGTTVSELWAYDPIADSWVQKQSMPAARRHGHSWSIGGKGYVVCGFNASGVGTNTLFEYDPVLDSWSVRASLPAQGRYGPHGFALGDHGYVGGGCIGSASGPYLSDMWRYDVTTDEWSAAIGVPGLPRYGATSWTINGYGYVQGGKDSSQDFTTELWRYDPIGGAWSSEPPRPGVGLSYTMVMAFPYEAVVACGKDELDLNNYEAFNYVPSLDLWIPIPDYPGMSGWSGASFGIGARTFGGLGAKLAPQSGYFNDFWELVKINDVAVEEVDGESVGLRVIPSLCSGDEIRLSVVGTSLSPAAGYRIMDATGRELSRGKIGNGLLDISALPSGSYVVRSELGKAVRQASFVVAR